MLMRLCFTFLWLLLLVVPALAAESNDSLAGFDLVIGDTGSAPDGWLDKPNRVYALVAGAGDGYYFSDMASAFFVLHEKHGDPIRMLELSVAEYGSARMIDARRAWFFWDSERLAPGGLPLILAFRDKTDARYARGMRG